MDFSRYFLLLILPFSIVLSDDRNDLRLLANPSLGYIEDDLKSLTNEIRDMNHNISTRLDGIESRMQRLESDVGDIKTIVQQHWNEYSKRLLPSSCSEALQSGKTNGIYRLYIPHSNLEPFDVYCKRDTGNDPAWTVIQRRQDGSVDFYRNWTEYKHGFGNLNGEFWIGLDKIHAMTSYQSQSLWIYLEDFHNGHRYAQYDKFGIADEYQQYTLNVLGKYSGTAKDSLRYHFDNKFSTYDRDNDRSPARFCAVEWQGAWWYNSCYKSSLNGPFAPYATNGKSICWDGWKEYYSLKYSHMAIRPNK